MGLLDSYQSPGATPAIPTQGIPSGGILDSYQSPAPSAPAAPKQQGDPGQAFVEGIGQTASMGYLPQLQAGTEMGVDKLSELLGMGPAGADAKLREQGFSVPEESYVQKRDANIARQGAQAATNPLAANLGKGLGVVTGGALLPLGRAAAGIKTAGQAIGQGAKSGALLGALINPGDSPGEVSPMQLSDRAMNAGIGGTAGALMSGAGAGIKSLADKSRMVERVKDSANLAPEVKGEINQALTNVREKYIAPRANQVAELQQGVTSQINPDRLQGISPGLDALASKMSGKVNEEGRRVLPDVKADRLRQLLDARAKYGASQPFDATATAKGESAKAAADILRRQINEKPGVGPLKAEMANAYRLSNALRKKSASSPISAIKGKPGTDKGSLIDAIDKMGGNELEKLSNQIQEASGLLMKPSNLVKPLEMPNELRKMLIRSAAGTARGLESAIPENSQDAILRTIFDQTK